MCVPKSPTKLVFPSPQRSDLVFSITDTLTDSLARLTADEQKAKTS